MSSQSNLKNYKTKWIRKPSHCKASVTIFPSFHCAKDLQNPADPTGHNSTTSGDQRDQEIIDGLPCLSGMCRTAFGLSAVAGPERQGLMFKLCLLIDGFTVFASCLSLPEMTSEMTVTAAV